MEGGGVGSRGEWGAVSRLKEAFKLKIMVYHH